MRSYHYTPRPHVEYHHHIQDLIEGQEKRAEDREYQRNKKKNLEERNDLIKDGKQVVVTDFFCHKCKQDFKSMSVKEIEIDWSNPAQYIAFYRSKCDEGHWCIRLITDKLRDPFWMNSRRVAMDRGTHYNDILQPFESGYNLLYGKR